MQLSYDVNADVLYISIGEPRAAISEMIAEDVILRRDVETNEVIGLTLLSMARFSAADNSHEIPVELTLRLPEHATENQ